MRARFCSLTFQAGGKTVKVFASLLFWCAEIPTSLTLSVRATAALPLRRVFTAPGSTGVTPPLREVAGSHSSSVSLALTGDRREQHPLQILGHSISGPARSTPRHDGMGMEWAAG